MGRSILKRIVLAATIAALAGGVCAWADGTPCDGLTSLKLPNTEITSSTLVAKGAFTQPRNNNGGAPPAAPAGANRAQGGAGGQAGPGGPGAPGGQGGPGGGQNA